MICTSIISKGGCGNVCHMLGKICLISSSFYSINRVDLTFVYGGWPTEQLQFTITGTNLYCEEKTKDGKLMVLPKSKIEQKCGLNKLCSLNSVAVRNDTESCEFTCKRLFRDPCEKLFKFFGDNEAEICEIDIPDEYNYRNIN